MTLRELVPSLFSGDALLSPTGRAFIEDLKERLRSLETLGLEEKVLVINELRRAIHALSPFKDEPVDCVEWVRSEDVIANDYNPNSVAPPEMRLLEHSIAQDGYTQPIVAWTKDGHYEVVDGFHRNRVGRESASIRRRIHGYLPLSIINPDREDRGDRIAATIRHNRARGKHRVDAMSDIVVELRRRNWSNDRICRELGMDPDEVLRLCQVSGLAELFADQEFSKSWDVEGEVTELDFEELSDDVGDGFRRTVNVGSGRILHTYDKWECYAAGFYATVKPGVSKADAEEMYRAFLADLERFGDALERVISEWKHSCEHYLTNTAMNRIAWLGQASACYALGLPSVYRGGFHLLSEQEQTAANELALTYLNKWLVANDREPVDMATALTVDRQSELY